MPLTPADEASLFKDTDLAVGKALKNLSTYTPANEKASPFKDIKLAVGQALSLIPADEVNMVLNVHRKLEAY